MDNCGGAKLEKKENDKSIAPNTYHVPSQKGSGFNCHIANAHSSPTSSLCNLNRFFSHLKQLQMILLFTCQCCRYSYDSKHSDNLETNVLTF